MRRILGLTSILFLLSVAPVYAGHGGRGGGGPVVRDHRGGGGGGPVVRDHRGGGGGPVVVRDHRGGPGPGWGGGGPKYKARGPVRVVGGRYMFPGGVVRVYKRPVIRAHYYDLHVRPAVIVEDYEPMDGYVWVAGNWRWGGAEWIWVPGYYSVGAVAPAPSAGVTVSAGVSIF